MKTKREEIRKRYLELLEILVESPELTTDEVAERMKVSLKVAWSDITELDRMGLVEKVRGGVKSKMGGKDLSDHTSFDYRSGVQKDEKRAIAQYVVKQGYVESGTYIILDSGTTIGYLFEAVLTQKALKDVTTVVTNNLALAEVLFPVPASLIRLILAGGGLWKSGKCLVGRETEEFFLGAGYKCKMAFISANSISLSSGGVFGYDPQECQVKKAMIRNAREIVIVADHSKFRVGGGQLFGMLKWVADESGKKKLTLLAEWEGERLGKPVRIVTDSGSGSVRESMWQECSEHNIEKSCFSEYIKFAPLELGSE